MAKAWNFITKNQYENCAYNDITNYPPSAWIINADFSAVGGKYIPDVNVNRYWKQDSVDLQLVVEMSSAEKDIIDASNLPEYKEVKKILLKTEFKNYVDSRYLINCRTFYNELYDSASGLQKTYIESFWAWINSIGTYFASLNEDIDSAANKTVLDAIVWDFTTFTASDPEITIEGFYAI